MKVGAQSSQPEVVDEERWPDEEVRLPGVSQNAPLYLPTNKVMIR